MSNGFQPIAVDISHPKCKTSSTSYKPSQQTQKTHIYPIPQPAHIIFASPCQEKIPNIKFC